MNKDIVSSETPQDQPFGNVSGERSDSCVFCQRINSGEYDHEFADHVMFEPLNPVTPGHMLVVPRMHSPHLNTLNLDADQTGWALRYFTNDLEQYNIITSKGANATQTIQHLHFHIVPRTKDDGLMLPWTGQEVATLALSSADSSGSDNVPLPSSSGEQPTSVDLKEKYEDYALKLGQRRGERTYEITEKTLDDLIAEERRQAKYEAVLLLQRRLCTGDAEHRALDDRIWHITENYKSELRGENNE